MLPLSYTIRSLFKHKTVTILTIIGISLVVFVFAGSFMLSRGLGATLVASGYDENAIVIRKSSQTEVQSILYYDQANIIKTIPEIARDANGDLLYTNEIYVLISLDNRNGEGSSNVPVRGVTDKSLTLRPRVKLIEGRMWEDPGSEIIAGKATARSFQGAGLGETVRFGARDWTIVGIFDAEGSSFDSELWGEINQMSDAFRRPIYSSLTFRMQDTLQFAAMKDRLENDPRLPIEVLREKQYYKQQSEFVTTFISYAGGVISFIFSLGAIVGAMITMYAAVANRVREIGTLRSLGFSRISILTSFLIESVFISLAGGLLGIAAAYSLQTIEVSTLNWDTFSEIAFNFYMSWEIAITSIIFAVVMGIVGGFLPAVHAARLKIVEALKAI